MTDATTLRVMPREMRMMTERILSLTGVPKGVLLAMQDTVMLSERLGLGGFALLEARFESLKAADPARVTIAEEAGPALRLDAGGQHAWVATPCLTDLLGELVQRHGTAEIAVVGAVDPHELGIVVALARRSGLEVALAGGGDEPRLIATAGTIAGDLARHEPLLRDLLENGAAIEADLWWRIYDLAQTALTPDSVASRRHAGPLIVNEDGTVTGRADNDDDTDIGFLSSPSTGKRHSEGAAS